MLTQKYQIGNQVTNKKISSIYICKYVSLHLFREIYEIFHFLDIAPFHGLMQQTYITHFLSINPDIT